MNTLFLIYLIVEAIFGIGFLFVPDLVMGPLGVTLDEASITLARMFGSLLIGIPVLIFLARRSSITEFRRGAMYFAFTYLLASTVVLLITQINGLMNAMGWGIVILHLVFMLWFGYYLLKPVKRDSV
jgi:hypothetical protein